MVDVSDTMRAIYELTMIAPARLLNATRRFCTHQPKQNDPPDKPRRPIISPSEYLERGEKGSHTKRLNKYFASEPHLQDALQYIPDKHLKLKRYKSIESMYLVDSKIGGKIVNIVLPHIYKGDTVCETSPGLAFVTSSLLDVGFRMVRMYEACPQFRITLRDFRNVYPGRAELFVKDIFQLPRISSMDKMDKSNRVKQLLKGFPKKDWSNRPSATIIGTMPKITFLTYCLKMLAMQSEIMALGRIQLFVVMRPGDYIKLTAGPELDLHTYQSWSVLFQLFFDQTLLDKFPREAFLPWETKRSSRRYFDSVDLDKMYFVRIVPKKKLPVPVEHILPLFYFVRQFYGKGRNKVIPTVEKLIPDIGLRFLVPAKEHTHYFDDLNIYTMFGELRPQEILSLFKEMIDHPGYANSAFAALVNQELLSSETTETLVNDSIPIPEIIDDLEEKLD